MESQIRNKLNPACRWDGGIAQGASTLQGVDTFPSYFPALKRNQGTCLSLLGPRCLQPCWWGVTQAKGTKEHLWH